MVTSAEVLGSRQLVVVSNREPYEHRDAPDGEVRIIRPAGGLTSALDPLMQEAGGTWVAWGSGSADWDVVDENGLVGVPPEEPRYWLKRLKLEKDLAERYYLGLANGALWPLCHLLLQHYRYDEQDWLAYQAANARFGQAAAAVVKENAVVWLQDYHLALVAPHVRTARPSAAITQFWHIPWPPADILAYFPRRVDLLEGLLANDLIGFHSDRYVVNFLGCVADMVNDVDVDSAEGIVLHRGHECRVRDYPISIDYDRFVTMATSPRAERLAEELRARYCSGGRLLGLGVDRADYTKGIPQRLESLDRLWSEHPEFRERLTFVQVATPTRGGIAAYDDLADEVRTTVQGINSRFGTPAWEPFVLIDRNVAQADLAGYYRAADLCIVSSVQDGMNLVAKEYAACQVAEIGVLVLSRFAGAAEEIDGAILVNPFDINAFTAAVRRALEMSQQERRVRMSRMRAHLKRNTVYHWMERILADVTELRGPQG
jgi:trehalose 6-phosphate synthase